MPITFVRPSIIESALAEPRPGWIRGFRMAEPIIVSYARGLLREFPGVPEGIIDVIPVDLVVAAILAVAARGPEPRAGRRCTTWPRACGTRCATGTWSSCRRTSSADNPLYDDRRPAHQRARVVLPGPGPGAAPAQAGRHGHDLRREADRLPCRSEASRRSWRPRIEDRHALAKRALGYVELYGAYTETDARYRVDRLIDAVGPRATPTTTRTFCSTRASSTGTTTCTSPPALGARAHPGAHQARQVGGRASGPSGPRKAILSPDRHLAVFDLEHTLMSSNVVDTYAWLASRHLPAGRAGRASWPTWCARRRRCWRSTAATAATSCARSTAASRTRPSARLREDSWELFHRQLLTQSFPDGFARVRAHRAARPPHAADHRCARLRHRADPARCSTTSSAPTWSARDGRLTGHLTTLPPIGEARALVLADYADAHGLSLEESVAYADSASDLAMLEAVGFPVAVNPEARLAAIARRRGWHVEHWAKAEGGSHRPLPLGPFDRRRSPQAAGRGGPAIGERR